MRSSHVMRGLFRALSSNSLLSRTPSRSPFSAFKPRPFSSPTITPPKPSYQFKMRHVIVPLGLVSGAWWYHHNTQLEKTKKSEQETELARIREKKWKVSDFLHENCRMHHDKQEKILSELDESERNIDNLRFTKEEVEGLTSDQIDAFLLTKGFGVKAGDLKGNNELTCFLAATTFRALIKQGKTATEALDEMRKIQCAVAALENSRERWYALKDLSLNALKVGISSKTLLSFLDLASHADLNKTLVKMTERKLETAIAIFKYTRNDSIFNLLLPLKSFDDLQASVLKYTIHKLDLKHLSEDSQALKESVDLITGDYDKLKIIYTRRYREEAQASLNIHPDLLNDSQPWFCSSQHVKALKKLTQQDGFSFSEALAQLESLAPISIYTEDSYPSSDKLYAVIKGYSTAEVLKWSKEQCCEKLKIISTRWCREAAREFLDIPADLLNDNHPWFCSYLHLKALKKLTQKDGFSFSDALAQLESLAPACIYTEESYPNSDKLAAIVEGLATSQALKWSNEQCLLFYNHHKTLTLPQIDLLNGYKLDNSHVHLIDLLIEDAYPVEKILEAVKTLDNNTAKKLQAFDRRDAFAKKAFGVLDGYKLEEAHLGLAERLLNDGYPIAKVYEAVKKLDKDAAKKLYHWDLRKEFIKNAFVDCTPEITEVNRHRMR